MKALIAYTTDKGHTRKVADRISEALRGQGHTAQVVDLNRGHEGVYPQGFDVVFLGSPIIIGGYSRALRRFVQEHRAALTRIPTAFFSVGLAVASLTSDGRAQTMEVVERFMQKTAWHPRRVELVAGALPYSKYNFLVRFIMRNIAAKEGGDTDTSRDYEYTDWEAVDRFATEFASRAAQSRGSLAAE